MLTAEQLAESPWFDAEWYCAQYPDAASSGISAAEHYLRFGEAEGRWPGPGFDPEWYLATYSDVAATGQSPLAHYIRYGEKEGRLPGPLVAPEWDSALWCRQAPETECLQQLAALTESTSCAEASYAAFALGRWHAWQNDWPAAAACLAGRPKVAATLPSHAGPALLEIEAHGRCGQLAKAWQVLAALHRRAPSLPDVSLAVANLLAWQVARYGEAPQFMLEEWGQQRLAWINTPWQQAGLHRLRRRDPAKPLSLDNLAVSEDIPSSLGLQPAACSSPCSSPRSSPRLSVIVPAYNAADALPTALDSLANQSLAFEQPGALEVIVVDDASTDGTAEVAAAFARRYSGSRVDFRVIRQLHNQGAYAARNQGLQEARGEFMTVHDSDDWSHPQKLALQLRGMHDNPQWMASLSHWVRCTPGLIFSRWRMEEGWVYRNVSSLMFRREVFETLGFWDRVRVEADTEYYYRIRAAYGVAAMGEVLPGVPLSFGRAVASSLTAVGDTHLVTQFRGVRADYRAASQAWHAQAGSPQELYLSQHPEQRPFAVPATLLP